MFVYSAERDHNTRQVVVIICVQSTLALLTPRYNGHPENTDSS